MGRFQGIVGLTSELKLWRFRTLAKIVYECGVTIDNKTMNIIGSKIKITTPRTLERQFSIMKKIKLVDGAGNIQALTGVGKALAKLNKDENKKLSIEEKIFFFTQLFTVVTKDQLIVLLNIISQNDGASKITIIKKYFSTDIAKSLWKTASSNIRKLEEGKKMGSLLMNKFGCLSGWLQELDLIKIENDGIISQTNPKIIDLLNSQTSSNSIYQIASNAYSIRARKFNQNIDSKIFYDYFKQNYNEFRIGSENFSDIKAIQKCISILLLINEGIILEDMFFNEQIEMLVSKGSVRSVMLGRDGKPAYVVA